MKTHTPGPWSINAYGKLRSASSEIAQFDNPRRVSDADARLIAAAPELADALRECVASYVDVEHANTYRSNDALAIVKANERIRAAQGKARAILKKAGITS